jgi:predicted ester cyclase
MAQPDDAKAIVRRFFGEGVNAKNKAVFEELLPDPDLRFLFEYFIIAFPDLELTVDAWVAEDDLVCTRGVFRGTHAEWYGGVDPSGKLVEVPYLDMWRVQDGRLVENWVQWDHQILRDALEAP